MPSVQPMSDRRVLVLVVAALVVPLGAVVVIAAAIALQDPFTISGEIGTRVDASRELVAALAVGLLLVVAGTATCAGLIRAQLRTADAPRP